MFNKRADEPIDLKGTQKIKFILMKEHPLLGYALSFMAGAYIALRLDIPVVYVAALLFVSIALMVVLTLQAKHSWYFILVVFLAVGYVSAAAHLPKWYKTDYVPPEECRISGTVESVKSTGYSYQYILGDVTLDGDEITSKIKVSNITDRDYIDPGDRITLRGVPERPAVSQQPGMFSEARYLMTKDIQYVCTIFNSRITVVGSDQGIIPISTKLQQIIFSQLNKDFAQPVSGVLYSLATGDKSYMDKDMYSRCADLGIAHIFAISGLHIGALLILWELYCRKTKKRFLTRILGSTILVLVLYLVVGARASLLRAIAMWALIVVYQYAGIKGDLLDFLSIAMLGLLIINPLYVIDVGFLLSAACVAAIALVYSPVVKAQRGQNAKRLISFYPVSLFIVSLSVLSVSWIITAKVFGQVALLSPLWNVVFVPLIVVLISLMLGYFLLFYVPIVSAALVWIVDKLVQVIVYLTKMSANVNVQLHTTSVTLAAALVVIAIILLMTDAAIKGRKALRLWAGTAAILLVMVFVAFLPNQDRLDVYSGYNAAFVYICEDGETLLIINEDDGGIERVLENIGQEKLDVMIYSGNDINDLEQLINGAEGIALGRVIVHKDLLEAYEGTKDYIGIDSFEEIGLGRVGIYLTPFKANENAVVHYYVHIDYYDREFVYIDPLRLRESALENSGIIICSRWSKQRIENVIYAQPEYVIMNSRDHLMDNMPITKERMTVPAYNINYSGAFTYYP